MLGSCRTWAISRRGPARIRGSSASPSRTSARPTPRRRWLRRPRRSRQRTCGCRRSSVTPTLPSTLAPTRLSPPSSTPSTSRGPTPARVRRTTRATKDHVGQHAAALGPPHRRESAEIKGFQGTEHPSPYTALTLHSSSLTVENRGSRTSRTSRRVQGGLYLRCTVYGLGLNLVPAIELCPQLEGPELDHLRRSVLARPDMRDVSAGHVGETRWLAKLVLISAE